MSIGVFDSGVGGLTVWRHVRAALPAVPLLYVADQAHVPYGGRPAAEIIRFAERISRFLLAQGAQAIVVACNTATAAAIDPLRAAFPETPFVGMEPAVKPAAAATRSGKIGVLATAGTFQSQRYAALLGRFAEGVAVFESDCPGLVAQIESGAVGSAKIRMMLHRFLDPMLAAGVDTVILGCTHYPLVLPLIREICGSDVAVIDPAPAVARQTARVYGTLNPLNHNQKDNHSDRFWTTAAAGRPVLERVLGKMGQTAAVHRLDLAPEGDFQP